MENMPLSTVLGLINPRVLGHKDAESVLVCELVCLPLLSLDDFRVALVRSPKPSASSFLPWLMRRPDPASVGDSDASSLSGLGWRDWAHFHFYLKFEATLRQNSPFYSSHYSSPSWIFVCTLALHLQARRSSSYQCPRLGSRLSTSCSFVLDEGHKVSRVMSVFDDLLVEVFLFPLFRFH